MTVYPILYDPDCGFCRVCIAALLRWDRQRRLRPVSLTSPEADTLLARIPDLSEALRQASPGLKRQVFEAFGVRITYDRLQRRIEISATISEAVAEALKNTKSLPEEALVQSLVAPRDIAGARFVRGSDARIAERYALAA